MLTRLTNLAFRLMEAFIVLALAAMVVMVFANVVLRYGFNSGITVSEELARFVFVWLTFVGAVVTFREHAHLGVETLVKQFGARGRLISMVLADAIIVLCMVVLFVGTWMQLPINATIAAPVTGIPLIWVYGVTLFTASGIGLLAAARIVRAALGLITDAELRAFAGERDAPTAGERGE